MGVFPIFYMFENLVTKYRINVKYDKDIIELDDVERKALSKP